MSVEVKSNSLGKVLIIVGFFLLILLLHLRLNPAANIVGQESGIFYYAGQRIQQGDLLYRDLWDAHPPGMHYLNALVIQFDRPAPWVIWWLEIAILTATAYILSIVLRRILPGWLSIGMVLVFLGTVHDPSLLTDLNFGEVFALLPQVTGIFFLILYLESHNDRWIFFLGMSASISAYLNPASILLGLAAGMVGIFLHPGQSRKRTAISGLAGMTILPLLTAAYWALQGSFQELWSVLVESNVAQLTSVFSIRSVYAAVRHVVIDHPFAPLFVLSAGTMFFLVVRILYGRSLVAQPEKNLATQMTSPELALMNGWLGIVIMLALPIEILLVNLSLRNHGHSYLMLVPSLVLGSAVLLARFSNRQQSDREMTGRIFIGVVGILLLGWLVNTIRAQEFDLSKMRRLTQLEGWSYVAQPAAAGYIFAHTESEDRVLVWGQDIQVNYLTGRRSPSQFLSPSSVLEMASRSPELLIEFIDSVRRTPPRLVLIPPNGDNLPDLFDVGQPLCPHCAEAILTELMVWREFMVEHYERVQALDGWDIYQWVD